MMGPGDCVERGRWADRLDELRKRLESGPAAMTEARAAAEGLAQEAENRPMREASHRLAALAEVWECLAGEDPARAEEVEAFCGRALGHLAEALRSSPNEADVDGIIAESNDRWGSYINLLEPRVDDWGFEAEASPIEGPAPEPAPSAVDIHSLLEMLGVAPVSRAVAEDLPSKQAPRAELSRNDSRRGPSSEGPGSEIIGWQGAAKPTEVRRESLDFAALTHPTTESPRRAGRAMGRNDVEAMAPPVPMLTSSEVPVQPSLLELDPELRDAFLADADDLSERLETISLGLGRDPSNVAEEVGRELERCLHTLKGTAGSVGLTQLSDLVHALEDRLEPSAGGLSNDWVDLLQQSLGYFNDVLTSLRQGTPVAAVPAALASRMYRRPNGQSEITVAADAPEQVTGGQPDLVPSAAAPAVADGMIRVSSEKFDELMDLVSELIARRGQWAAQADSIKDFAATARVGRNRLMSSVDRLRDLALSHGPAPAAGPDADIETLARSLAEQAEDLAALADAARGAADPLADDADALARLALRLWDTLQAIRVVPIRGLFHRLARVAREAARVEGRLIEVVLVGEDVGMDRSVQDKAFEPLLHAVRNAVCHGIEPADQRVAAGKPPQGRVTLEARREGYTLVLKVQDDGRGLDHAAIAAQGRRLGLLGADEEVTPERLQALVFRPGFSTRQRADAIAGRGVGMDVVAQEVARLHGSVDLVSQSGRGTTLTVRLSARVAVEQAMVVRVAGRAFALPLVAIDLVQSLAPADRDATAIQLHDHSVRLLSARKALGLPSAGLPDRPKLLLIKAEGRELALVVDEIEGPRELVIKPMGPLLAGHPLIAGTSLSPAGELILALDPYGLVRCGSVATGTAEVQPKRPRRVLVVDDALSVRRVARRHLGSLGLETDEAADGIEALHKMRTNSYRLVLTDLEMPRMDGFELLAELRRSGASAATPVVVTSTRSDPQTLRRVLQLGARALLPKPIVPDALAVLIGSLLRQTPGDLTAPLPLVATPGR